jgi:diguanylate cyclase (GGDEF)-like protein
VSTPIIVIATATVTAVLTALGIWPAIHRLQTRLAAAIRQARRDPLTGLYNRAGLAAFHQHRRDDYPQQALIVAVLDVDDLKTVNDTLGHTAGDQLLTVIAGRLADSAAMHGGVAARLSGDEFALLLPYEDGHIGRIVDGIATAASAPTWVTVDDHVYKIGGDLSAGTSWGDPAEPLSILLRRADIALYHAKHGDGRHVLYDPDLTMPLPRPRTGGRLRDQRQHTDEGGGA